MCEQRKDPPDPHNCCEAFDVCVRLTHLRSCNRTLHSSKIFAAGGIYLCVLHAACLTFSLRTNVRILPAICRLIEFINLTQISSFFLKLGLERRKEPTNCCIHFSENDKVFVRSTKLKGANSNTEQPAVFGFTPAGTFSTTLSLRSLAGGFVFPPLKGHVFGA